MAPVAYLADEQSVDGWWNTGSKDINGTTFTHSIYAGLDYCSSTDAVEYDLGRHYKTFAATVGLSDTSSSQGSIQFEVFLDGSPAPSGTVTLGLGESHGFNLNVSNVLRLRLTMVPGSASSCGGQTGVWGNARISQ